MSEARKPALAAALGVLYFGLWVVLQSWPPDLHGWLTLSLAPPLIWLSLTDVERTEIPDAATLLFSFLSFVLLSLSQPEARVVHLLSAAIVLALFWGLGEVYFRLRGQEGLGIGDAKLLAAATLLLGPEKLPELFILASIGGIIAHVISRRRATAAEGIPFGPFIALAAFGLNLIEPVFW